MLLLLRVHFELCDQQHDLKLLYHHPARFAVAAAAAVTVVTVVLVVGR